MFVDVVTVLLFSLHCFGSTRIHPDPLHLAGSGKRNRSGSGSGSEARIKVDPDPGGSGSETLDSDEGYDSESNL